ncbi:MAG TPA: cytochrome c3 family protein [Bdellovibrionota bacterium]|nr:cytochrome c3 family protein [Bdellovibrionota bacterium]
MSVQFLKPTGVPFTKSGLAFVGCAMFAISSVFAANRIDPKKCVDCHDVVDPKVFKASVHGELACTDCHAGGPFGEHEEAPQKVNCGSCHEDAEKEYRGSTHGTAKNNGISDAPSCVDCHGDAHLIQPFTSETARHSKANVPALCAKCHADIKLAKKYDIPVSDPVGAYKNSVHGRAIAAGNLKAAVCTDCHGYHTIQPGREMMSAVSKKQIPATCGRCHSDILEDYKVSVHGQAVARGITDAPACTDCHGEHAIVDTKSPESPVSPAQLTTKTCGHCHSDLTLAQRYGFSIQRLSTYMQSYHGMAVRRGSVTVANCSSCHETHRILPSSDTRSSIHPDNLAKTCGKCHPDATQAFSRVPVHLDTSPTASPILYWVRILYLWMIVSTIGLMLLHNLLIYAAAVVKKIRSHREEVVYTRFTTIQLVAHGLLLVSFTTLVITGFALHFSRAGWTVILDWVHLGEHARGVIHRTSAVIMLSAGVLHIFHSIFTRQGRKEIRELLPRLTDVRDLSANIFYYVKLVRARAATAPKLGRYTYIHKAEYWALIWGTIVMSVTGFALWFPELFSRFLPVWGIPLAELIHYFEAWLATLAILVWHLFFVIFHPDEYPMNVTWLTGKVTRHEMERDHPRELDRPNP